MTVPTAGSLVGAEWVLEDLCGRGALDYAESTLAFPEAGKVAGNGACNRFVGTVEVTGEAITVGPLAATRRACSPAVMDQEIKYLKALEGAERIAIDGPYLLIYVKDHEQPLRFTRKD